MRRTWIGEVVPGSRVRVRGWVRRVRALKHTTFVVVTDASGELQATASPTRLAGTGLKAEDAVELVGEVRQEPRAAGGRELMIEEARVLGSASAELPFVSSAPTLAEVGAEILLEHRTLSLRHPEVARVFRLQARLAELFRAGLRRRRFTEIFTSKLVGGGTEGGTNVFEVKYFERRAFLAQSPQLYKEQCAGGLERVFEVGHVYRAEPHASSRHLTEYVSLDVELAFTERAEDLIELERELLSEMFEALNAEFGPAGIVAPLPTLERAPVWEFGECLERLGRPGGADLDPEGERALCAMAEAELGVPAVFVLGFPLSERPFYTAARGESGAAESFDLLFRGVEITTGGQRLHRRGELEARLRARGIDPAGLASHLRMFELGMPPHGGFAIGLERLTAQILGLANVRAATLYPRDRYRLEP